MSKICINNEGLERFITKGNRYTILCDLKTMYEILTDKGNRIHVSVERFEP
jgi:hypothetical protein